MLGTVNIFYSFEIELAYQPINNEMVNKYHSMDCLSLVFRAVIVIDASHVTLQNK